MSVVTAAMVRDMKPTMFDDLLGDYPGASYTSKRANGLTTLTFNVDLDDATAAAIRERMATHDDADLALRAVLRADRDALAPDDPLRRLYDYMLGD